MKTFHAIMLGISLTASSSAAFAAETPAETPALVAAPVNVIFEKALHFDAKDGSSLTLEGGNYLIGAEAGGGLRLTSANGKSVVIAAAESTQAEKVASPRALIVAVGEDARRLVLLLPDGKQLEANGSASGVRSRGLSRGEALAGIAQPLGPLPVRTGPRTPIETPVGPAPQNVHMQPGGPLTHSLVWDRLPGISGYTVAVNNTATRGTWMLATPAPILAELYEDRNFPQPGAQYRVTALYPDGRQGSSDFVYANPPQLQVPTGFTAQQIGPGQVRLAWQPVNLAKGYRLYGPGQPFDGTFIAATQFVLSNLPDGTYNWQLTADYGGAWQGAGMPIASITLATAASGNYLVTITGLRAVWGSVDDMLSRDGKGDEVYVRGFVRKYDRRTGGVDTYWPTGTLTYGDVNNFGTSRVQAGTSSASGGIRDGDPIPDGSDPTQRVLPPMNNGFPLRLYEGKLTNGIDALVISPTLWEEDGGNLAYALWIQQMNNITGALFQRPEIQAQLAKGTFEPMMFGTSAVPGMSDAMWMAAMVNAGATLGGPTGGLSIVYQLGERMFAGDKDRPIGLIPTGFADSSMALPNKMVVLNREIIEAALASQPPGTPPKLVGPPFWPRMERPGVMMIPFHDGPHSSMLGMERPAYYEMYLKVERIP